MVRKHRETTSDPTGAQPHSYNHITQTHRLSEVKSKQIHTHTHTHSHDPYAFPGWVPPPMSYLMMLLVLVLL